MTDIDGNMLELIERQLAERVAERVRSALFRLYASMGVAVIGVLRSLGYTDRNVPDVVVKSLVNYSGKKTRLGVLELWL